MIFMKGRLELSTKNIELGEININQTPWIEQFAEIQIEYLVDCKPEYLP